MQKFTLEACTFVSAFSPSQDIQVQSEDTLHEHSDWYVRRDLYEGFFHVFLLFPPSFQISVTNCFSDFLYLKLYMLKV